MKNKSYSSISPTAKLIAYLRTFTDIPFSKELAKHSGSEGASKKFLGKELENLINSSPRIESRYKLINKALFRVKASQIIELASGMSPRGLNLTKNSKIKYVETDLPKILKEKEKLVMLVYNSSKKIKRKNLRFEALNVLSLIQFKKALKSFDLKPIAIVSEGLIPYLDHKEKEVLLKNINSVLSKYGGVWVTSDISTSQTYKTIITDDKEVRKIAEKVHKIVGRNIRKNAFKDEIEVIRFFKKYGNMKVKFKIPQDSIIDNLSSIKKLKLDKKVIREKLKGSYIWVFELIN